MCTGVRDCAVARARGSGLVAGSLFPTALTEGCARSYILFETVGSPQCALQRSGRQRSQQFGQIRACESPPPAAAAQTEKRLGRTATASSLRRRRRRGLCPIPPSRRFRRARLVGREAVSRPGVAPGGGRADTHTAPSGTRRAAGVAHIRLRLAACISKRGKIDHPWPAIVCSRP